MLKISKRVEYAILAIEHIAKNKDRIKMEYSRFCHTTAKEESTNLTH